MEIKIIDNNKKIFNPDGTAKAGKGGTELMMEGLAQRLDPKLLEKFQIIASRVVDLDPSKKKILWLHDLVQDPQVSDLAKKEYRDQFTQLVFVSYHQFMTYHMGLGVPYDGSVILRNAIEPITPEEKDEDTIRIIYHTTPHRGLEILLPVFEFLAERHKNLHLDVYSSFNLYGWGERDKPYQPLFDKCNAHPQITYHGAVSNDEVRKALGRAHIFAYPSIWPETSCIAALEAMSAKVLVVCPDYAALSETVGDFGYMYRWSETGQVHVNRFLAALNAAITSINETRTKNLLENAKARVDAAYNWDLRAAEWTALLNSLVDVE